MSAAFAEREARERGVDVEIVTGGTDPADAVHPEVVETMREVDIDLAGRTPREVSGAELNGSRVVATMGCSTLSLDADTDVRDWDLPDPDGKSPERVREIRETIRERVSALFDELDAAGAFDAAGAGGAGDAGNGGADRTTDA
jgi:protein-tyrosine-phosphatase